MVQQLCFLSGTSDTTEKKICLFTLHFIETETMKFDQHAPVCPLPCIDVSTDFNFFFFFFKSLLLNSQCLQSDECYSCIVIVEYCIIVHLYMFQYLCLFVSTREYKKHINEGSFGIVFSFFFFYFKACPNFNFLLGFLKCATNSPGVIPHLRH